MEAKGTEARRHGGTKARRHGGRESTDACLLVPHFVPLCLRAFVPLSIELNPRGTIPTCAASCSTLRKPSTSSVVVSSCSRGSCRSATSVFESATPCCLSDPPAKKLVSRSAG